MVEQLEQVQQAIEKIRRRSRMRDEIWAAMERDLEQAADVLDYFVELFKEAGLRK